MVMKMTHRRKIQVISVTIAAILVLGGTTFSGYMLAGKYRSNLEYGYQRALNDLNAYVSNIESTLTKAVYANTIPQQNGIAGKLMRESSGAKAALAVLPLKSEELVNVNKFISQVGDFSNAISIQVSAGNKITEEEYKSILNLKKYAATLKEDLAQVTEQFGDGNIPMGETQRILSNLDTATPVLSKNLEETAKDFANYPTLIYDGPFSDHIAQKKPMFLEGKAQVLQGNAQNSAAEFLGVNQSALTHSNDSAGNLPTYNFTGSSTSISVTKAGGCISTMLNARKVDSAKLDFKAASQKAQEFFKAHNLTGLHESYYVINDNICTINYAYSENNIIYYPDLIKVAVALDTGEIVQYNSTGYLMNHHKRQAQKPAISEETARKSVSSRLKIEKADLTVIPSAGLSEVMCYEFLCTGENKEKVLVYINAKTGNEEQILILLFSDNGILTK
jgi:germination protein YpeB